LPGVRHENQTQGRGAYPLSFPHLPPNRAPSKTRGALPAYISCRSGAATVQPAVQARTPSWGVAAAATEVAAAAKAVAAATKGAAAVAATATKGAAAAATATKGAAAAAAAAAAATTTRAEEARATTPHGDSTNANKEEGDRDSPSTGQWRSIKTRQPSRSSLWTGSQTCKRSGGWLVEVASKRALLFLISSEGHPLP